MSLKRNIRRVLHGVGYDIHKLTTAYNAYLKTALSTEGIGLVLDIGANEGQYAQALRALGYEGRIISFEPGEAAFGRLEEASRPDSEWSCSRMALGSAPGTATLHIAGNSVSSSLLVATALHSEGAGASVRSTSSEDVEVTTLSAVLGDQATNVFVKLDVQGFELSVISGLDAADERVRLLQAEVSLAPLYEGEPHHLEVLGALEDRGLRVVHMQPGVTHALTGQLLQIDILCAKA